MNILVSVEKVEHYKLFQMILLLKLMEFFKSPVK